MLHTGFSPFSILRSTLPTLWIKWTQNIMFGAYGSNILLESSPHGWLLMQYLLPALYGSLFCQECGRFAWRVLLTLSVFFFFTLVNESSWVQGLSRNLYILLSQLSFTELFTVHFIPFSFKTYKLKRNKDKHVFKVLQNLKVDDSWCNG